MAETVKQAILAKLLRLGAAPIKGTPKLFMNLRTPAQLNALESGTRNALQKHINIPLEKGLTRLGVPKFLNENFAQPITEVMHDALPKMIHTAAPDLVPKLPPALTKIHTPAELEKMRLNFGPSIVNKVSQNPELMAMPFLTPPYLPGTTEGYLGAKMLLRKVLSSNKLK